MSVSLFFGLLLFERGDFIDVPNSEISLLWKMSFAKKLRERGYGCRGKLFRP